MAGISSTLETAKNALLNSQILIQTASHNIANADNKAYARQKALLVTNSPVQVRAGWLGMGTSVERIVQQRDQLIEKRLLGSISKESEYQTRASHLAVVGAYLSDTEESGLSQVLSEFWDAWEGLNQASGGLPERAIVTQAAQNLATTIQSSYRNLADYAEGIKDNIGNDISQANDLLSNIAEYNKEIVKAELQGRMPANDLRDLRYQALTKLSELIPVEFKEVANGAISVTVDDYSDGVTLVSGNAAGKLHYDDSDHRVTYSDYQRTAYPDGTDTASRNSLAGGRIQGSLGAYDSIGGYLEQLDTFASALIKSVNSTHGSDVFNPNAKASDIAVASGFEPDGTQALNLAELRQKTNTDLGGATFSKYLGGIQQRIGSDLRSATSRADFQTALRRQLEAQQQSVSGVSIDEEMIDLLKYQQSYQAAAKVIERSAEMLNRIIDMV